MHLGEMEKVGEATPSATAEGEAQSAAEGGREGVRMPDGILRAGIVRVCVKSLPGTSSDAHRTTRRQIIRRTITRANRSARQRTRF